MKICNIIVGLDTRNVIDLKNLAANDGLTPKYNPARFPGLSLKLTDPKATILVFQSGNLVCTGTKSIEDAHDALKKVLDVLNLPIKLVEFAVVHNWNEFYSKIC